MERRSRHLVIVLSAAFITVLGLLLPPPAYAAAPTITSFTPTAGPLGTSVTVQGTNFSAPATVSFNGVAATTTVVSATTLKATVPNSASTGPLSVTTPGGTATSAATFTVLPGLADSILAGPAGTRVTLFFSGFEPFEAVDVYFDTTSMTLVSATRTGTGSVTLAVPAGASPGRHSWTAIGRHSGSSAQAAFTVRTDWSTAGFDGRRAADNPYEHLIDTGNVDELTRSWTTAAAPLSSVSPIIGGGYVYVGTTGGDLRAFDLATGAQRWARPIGASISDSAAYAAGTVYVGDDAGHFDAVNAATGAVRWTYTVPSSRAVTAAPVVVGSLVVFGAADGEVHALDRTTGIEAWSSGSGGTGSSLAPAAYQGVVYFASPSSHAVVAWDTASGTPLWSRSVDPTVTMTTPPALAGRYLYIGGFVNSGAGSGTGLIMSIRASDGATGRSYTTPQSVETALAIDTQRIYVGDDAGTVTAFSRATGEIAWQSPTGLGSLRQWLAAVNGVLYVGGAATTNRSLELDAATGRVLGRLSMSTNHGSPAIVDGTLTMINSAAGTLAHFVLPDPGDPTVATPRRVGAREEAR